MTERVRVGVVYGGRSGEHEVSLRSARAVLDHLDPARYAPVLLAIDPDGRWHLEDLARAVASPPGTPLTLDPAAPVVTLWGGPEGACVVSATGETVARLDVVFPVVHGTYGEDGTLQGLLDMVGVAYVGSGVLGSSAAMDKDVAKKLLRAAGLPVVEWFVVRRSDGRDPKDVRVEAAERLGWPVFVKPANMGSSVGVSKVRGPAELDDALAEALRYDDKVIVERGHDVREVELAVLGNHQPVVSVAGEIAPTHEFYSYTAKYLDAGGATLSIPAALDAATHTQAQSIALRAFAALELSGLARVDLFVDRTTGEVFVNEVNTLPGFTSISMYPKLWAASGLSFTGLVDRLVGLAQERHAARQALCTRFAPMG